MPQDTGLANNGSFWLEIEMLSTDKVKQMVSELRRYFRIFPADPKQPSMEMLRTSRYIKPKMPVGLIRCSRANLGIFWWYMKAYKGSGRRFATSIGTSGVL